MHQMRITRNFHIYIYILYKVTPLTLHSNFKQAKATKLKLDKTEQSITEEGSLNIWEWELRSIP